MGKEGKLVTALLTSKMLESVLAIFDGVVGLVIAPVLGGLIWDVISPVHVISLMIGTTIAAIPLFLLIPETLRKLEF